MSPQKPANGLKRSAPSSSAATPAGGNAGKSDGAPAKRQKRDGNTTDKDHDANPTPAARAAKAASQSTGSHMMTQITYGIEYLKSKATPKTLQELLDHLTLHQLDESMQYAFAMAMQKHSRIQYNPPPKSKVNADAKVPAWRLGTYEFRPLLPGVNTKVALLDYLQHKKDSGAIELKTIKDGWPNCEAAIDELEREHLILCVRTKKENAAKFIFRDNPELHNEVDPEFKAMWFKEKLPPADEMPRKLKALGQKATSDGSKLANNVQKAAPKRKKASRVQKKFENEHMRNIFEQLKRK
ncbi:transcription initiation factor IIE, beta subunit [Hypoxylon trugodes]|uniref:transcription initiation factor IIE, beta subunit n=1 Tax=Hypoxylon trugodes TaxID=326681 RepID=UPI002193A3D4|nr:transcription initiation factor IIE, beta subunit [Hypoxylon trugodes]KAI1387502.1 transcription initiation factor IIE, beta subunit [Hypoxylon trugodes]